MLKVIYLFTQNSLNNNKFRFKQNRSENFFPFNSGALSYECVHKVSSSEKGSLKKSVMNLFLRTVVPPTPDILTKGADFFLPL